MDRIWNIGDGQILYSMVCRLRVARPLRQALVALGTSAYRRLAHGDRRSRRRGASFLGALPEYVSQAMS